MELSQYATDETDECNAAMSTYKREAIIDSGAAAHMTGDIDLLHSVVACTRGVRLADGHPIPVTAMGDLKIKSEETGRTATFKNVLYLPTLKKTLKDHCQLRNKNKLSITARWNDSYLYAIQGKFILPGMDDEANAAEAADAMLWHARMGHIPAGSMEAASKASIGGPTDLPKAITCEDCIRGKIQHTSMPKTGDRPQHSLGTCVHTDLWGPAKTASPNGAKYFITFTEDATNYVWVKFLSQKSDAYEAVMEYVPWLERQTGVQLKTLRTDGSGEYVSDKMEVYLKERGIHHEVSTRRRQWQNGTTERMNRTLVEMGRTMLHHAIAAKHCVTPHELIRGTKPKITSLKVFGCVAWRRNETQDKTASRANLCMFLGYSEVKKAYKVYDLEDKKTVFTVDCNFKKTEFHRPRTVFIEDSDDRRDGKRGTMVQVTKEDVDMDLPTRNHHHSARPAA
ncbi:hypothetical protein AaE_007410 [Aphanomyces astaci]|uniref:Integrase catalytic domain-containing protein n=1 Tax=Aphanomyces astaci TaxID=112090 RepID=A0A6A5AEG2_APHAT|nr:hypothetical protein AaE_007410 [Aphanomyces astaci]